ncbi:hypothetical protein SUH3_15705 [Pseudosulfitobacter pseudonitzschiae]|uniref:Uncharacterized protein n=2 Tax=Pseudosulfitobacter pseudonitzschiae TaxID=1402135 RepID=A0A073JGF5_9RHOB|nr:hypothetical protein SUH3_15705 [Pseudosulfitobacter pseudonitzschiae]
MDAIQRGLVLKVQSERMTGTYSLKGTMRALASARKCAYQNYQYVSSAPQQPSEYAHEVDKTPLFQVATQMITAVEAVDFRYLSDDEIKEMGFQDGVFWFSENLDILGGTMNLNAPDGNLRETDPSDISFMNSLCSGDFASKTRAVDTAEVDQRELHGYCIEGDRRLEMIALKTRFGTRVLYNILLFGPNSTQETTEREEVTGNIALHAARFVNSE